MKNNAYAKFGGGGVGTGINKVHYGRCASATTKQTTLKRIEKGVKHSEHILNHQSKS